MHPLNPYHQKPPNFLHLAQQYQPLEKFLIPSNSNSVTIDFQNPEAVRTLNYALLQIDFGITLTIPDDRLCPPVAGRLDYVLSMLDVSKTAEIYWKLLHTHDLIKTKLSSNNQMFSLDIGTGASAIYALLLATQSDIPKIYATDIDEKAIEYSTKNVSQNFLTKRIQIEKSLPSDSFYNCLGNQAEPCQSSFTMCNPPFYQSQQEIDSLQSQKKLAPFAICTGSPQEMITTGGESAFVLKLFEQSFQVANKVGWFSTLLGRYSTLEFMMDHFKKANFTNFCLTELGQSLGHTKRWILAWSHMPLRISNFKNSSMSSALKKVVPCFNTYSQKISLKKQQELNVPPKTTFDSAIKYLNEILNEADIITKASLDLSPNKIIRSDKVEDATDNSQDKNNDNLEETRIKRQNAATESNQDYFSQTMTIIANNESWSRSARRKRKFDQNKDIQNEDNDPILISTIKLCCPSDLASLNQDFFVQFDAHWIWGKDQRQFNSLSTHIIRKLQTLLTK